VSSFRYFRVTGQVGVDFYRYDPDKPEGQQIRRSDDGMWIHTTHRSIDGFLVDARGNGDVVAELPVDEVPCHLCMLADDTVTRILVREWPDAIAITPRPAPVVAGHVVVIPKVHATGRITPAVAGLLAARAAELAADHGDRSWNYIQSNGRAATQTEPHFHAHLVPREPGDGLALPWSPAPTHPEGAPRRRPAPTHLDGEQQP